MSLELFAQHYRKLGEEYEEKFNTEKIEVVTINEPEVVKNPFLTLKDIYDDAIPSVKFNKFYSVSLIGSQGFGKTDAAITLASFAASDGFLVIYAKAEDFMEERGLWEEQVKQKIKEHGKIQVCFIMDDMSYSTQTVSSKKSANFKHFIADIRHVLEPVLGDIEVFMVYISHRLHSLPPMLRNSGTWIFASMLPEDRADAMKLIPKSKEERERLDNMFQFLQQVQSIGPKKTSFQLNLGDKSFDFKWGKKEDPGDGRLMMVSHAGHMKILQSKPPENRIDLEATRIRPITLDNIEEEKHIEEDTKEIEARAREMFPVPKDDLEDLKHIIPIPKEYEKLRKIVKH